MGLSFDKIQKFDDFVLIFFSVIFEIALNITWLYLFWNQLQNCRFLWYETIFSTKKWQIWRKFIYWIIYGQKFSLNDYNIFFSNKSVDIMRWRSIYVLFKCLGISKNFYQFKNIFNKKRLSAKYSKNNYNKFNLAVQSFNVRVYINFTRPSFAIHIIRTYVRVVFD